MHQFPCIFTSPCTSIRCPQSCTYKYPLDGSTFRLSNGNPLPSSLNTSEQADRCAALCCSLPDCDAWAVHKQYTASWAFHCVNSTHPQGSDCCLLKKKGWRMDENDPACISGGKSAAPQPPAPSPPPPPAPPVVNGGGPCKTDWDCSLGGLCTAGACVCDPQYTGAQCGVMHLRRAKVSRLVAIAWGVGRGEEEEDGRRGIGSCIRCGP